MMVSKIRRIFFLQTKNNYGENKCGIPRTCASDDGYCDCFASAAVAEEEPRHPVSYTDVTFEIADTKALLTHSYCHPAREVIRIGTGELGGIPPLPLPVPGRSFHWALLNMIGGDIGGLWVDVKGGGRSNKPLFAYEST
ncbi:MAG: hypothetical protein GY854_33145 [Deltaproteobacteria bacterium]|nr:hypothetical protein [Deltaproteobacteria bacterium]